MLKEILDSRQHRFSRLIDFYVVIYRILGITKSAEIIVSFSGNILSFN